MVSFGAVKKVEKASSDIVVFIKTCDHSMVLQHISVFLTISGFRYPGGKPKPALVLNNPPMVFVHFMSGT